MAPTQNDPRFDLGIEFEALRGPVLVARSQQSKSAGTLLQRLNRFLNQLRQYG
jgi:hypothetical protein